MEKEINISKISVNDRRKISLFIIAFLLFQAFMIIRCYKADAKFFGWQMFSRPMVYRVEFYGMRKDGILQPLSAELYRRWMGKRGNGTFFIPSGKLGLFTRGSEYMFSELKRIPAFLCGKLAGEGFRRIELEMESRDVDESRFTRRVFRKEC